MSTSYYLTAMFDVDSSATTCLLQCAQTLPLSVKGVACETAHNHAFWQKSHNFKNFRCVC